MKDNLTVFKNKKGQLGKKIDVIFISIIFVVVLFSIFSALVPEAQTAGDSLNASNRCASVGCFYNSTDDAVHTNAQLGCRPSSSISNENSTCAVTNAIPLGGLFGSRGIVILLLMVGLILTIIKAVMPSKK